MEYEQIKKIIEDMSNSKLSSIDIEFPEGTKISMKKDVNVEINNTTNEVKQPVEVKTETNGKIITSPMVGTFYLKPEPDAKNYVEKGSIVKKGTILCIIEAMKLMNEIESEYEGTIEEIYVQNGEAVDYGKPLFKIV